MRGLILTGALGAGKTTAQDILVRQHGFWTPVTVTTRETSKVEAYVAHVALDDFIAGVIDKKYVLPAKFGTEWYAWTAADFSRLLHDHAAPSVVNVRPYTALLLASLVSTLLPVWLWIDPDELARRISTRGAARDLESSARKERARQDMEDKAYEVLFRFRLRSDEHLVNSLLNLLERESQ